MRLMYSVNSIECRHKREGIGFRSPEVEREADVTFFVKQLPDGSRMKQCLIRECRLFAFE